MIAGGLMQSDILSVIILHGGGPKSQDTSRLVGEMADLKLLQEASNPETFDALNKDRVPDIVLIDLNASNQFPDWLEPFIRNLRQSEIIVCSHCLDSEFLLRLLKLRVQFIPLPLSRENLEAAVMRARQSRNIEKPAPEKMGHVVAVAGSREGVGITSIATNLALAFADLIPEKVLLADLGRPFPAVGQFLNIKESHNIIDLVQGVEDMDPLFVEKILHQYQSNLSILLGNPDLTLDASLLLAGNALNKIFKNFRATFEWIVVDLGYWTDSLYLGLIREADTLLILAELAVPDLQNLIRIKKLLYRNNIDFNKIKIVVNRYEKNTTLGIKDLENNFKQRVFYKLPSDYASMADAINQGEPLAKVARNSKLWRSLKKLATELINQTKATQLKEATAKPGFLKRLFSR